MVGMILVFGLLISFNWAYGATNLALTGVATQSSTYYDPWYPHDASKCIDGITDGNPYVSICHTYADGLTWWQVDLLDTYFIGQIVVWSRSDWIDSVPPIEAYYDQLCYRLNDFDVSILDDLGQVVWSQHFSDCPRPSITIDLPIGTFGKVVKIDELSTDYMDMAEVQVFEGQYPPIPVTINVPNKINVKNNGKIPVKIFSSPELDVQSIDHASLTFGATGDEQSLASCNYGEDFNEDGLADLMCHFYKRLTGFETAGYADSILKGQTIDGLLIEGSDLVKIKGVQ